MWPMPDHSFLPTKWRALNIKLIFWRLCAAGTSELTGFCAQTEPAVCYWSGASFPRTYFPVMRTKRVCLFCSRVCLYVGLCMYILKAGPWAGEKRDRAAYVMYDWAGRMANVFLLNFILHLR